MQPRLSYDQQLRAIGQSLEAQRINVFELKHDGDRFLVKGDPEKETSLLSLLRQWQKQLRSAGVHAALSFGSLDIEQLEQQGRAKRTRPNRLPDFYSLPNTLRTVGHYLDAAGADLLEIHKRPLSLLLLYQNRQGHPRLEERTIASFYELFLRLHSARRNLRQEH